MSSFIATSYGLAAFYTLIGIILFWIMLRTSQKKQGFPIKGLLMANVILYLGLAHFAVYAAVGYSVEETVLAPCENVVNQSIVLNNSVIHYKYIDSCVNTEPAPITEKMLWGLNFALILALIQTLLWALWKSITWYSERY